MPRTATHSPRVNSNGFGLRGRLSGAPEALFAYGSLLFPEVQQALLGRAPRTTLASADGWRVAALPGRVYPALVPSTRLVTGALLLDLTVDEWEIIDAFEDAVYELREISLKGDKRGWAYVCDEKTTVLPTDWDAKIFAEQHLPRYAESCKSWLQQYQRR
jgi:gamma-glutamylcyclotransferase (GGCT)/AIG2-like uncharacterized protein YtfP